MPYLKYIFLKSKKWENKPVKKIELNFGGENCKLRGISLDKSPEVCYNVKNSLKGTKMKKLEDIKLIVNKSYYVNAMRDIYSTTVEHRILNTYLARINPKEFSTAPVSFSLEEFVSLCEIKDRNVKTYQKIADKILTKMVTLPLPNGGFDKFILFQRCRLRKDEYDEWVFELYPTEAGQKYFFEMILPYFSYNLKYMLKLKSLNQMRLYEILKQHEKMVNFSISILELKDQIGISNDKYSSYENLRKDVLEVCKNAINEQTDISFFYTPSKRKGKGGKITELTFTIMPKDLNQLEKTELPQKSKSIVSPKPISSDEIELGKINNKKRQTQSEIKEELEKARSHPLWKYALKVADGVEKKHVSSERYALGILRNWEILEYKTYDDLVLNGAISKSSQKTFKEKYYNLSFDVNDL
jgi:plasmid replication initiation protein